MYLKHLHLINFKNIPLGQLDLVEGINCFVGHNGAGKTNLLDAIYYMSFCKSYFNPADSQNIKHNNDFFVVQASYNINNNEEHVYCGIKKGQKKQFKRNKKEYTKLSNHIGLLPLVMIAPQDESLITEGGEARRKYLDTVISQYDKSYLDYLINYNKLLSQRNSFLKSNSHLSDEVNSMLDVWDYQMMHLAYKIVKARQDFLNDLNPIFQEYYQYISNNKEIVSFNYKSHLKSDTFEEDLKESRQKDLVLGYTTKGIHRDDVVFKIDDYAIKKVGSQGQRKTFLIALKLGQFRFLSDHKKIKPLLLLDDIFDKLDSERGGRLIELVGGDHFKQIFITDTQLNRIEPILKQLNKESRIFTVSEGEVEVYHQ